MSNSRYEEIKSRYLLYWKVKTQMVWKLDKEHGLALAKSGREDELKGYCMGVGDSQKDPKDIKLCTTLFQREMWWNSNAVQS